MPPGATGLAAPPKISRNALALDFCVDCVHNAPPARKTEHAGKKLSLYKMRARKPVQATPRKPKKPERTLKEDRKIWLDTSARSADSAAGKA
jgi:hypothetical protein